MVFIRNGEIVEDEELPQSSAGRTISAVPRASSEHPAEVDVEQQAEQQPLVAVSNAAATSTSVNQQYGATAPTSTEQLLLPPGLTEEDGVVVGTPIAQPPVGTAIGFRRGVVVDDFDDWDDAEQHTRCAVLCCGTCCPCCLGDPCTTSWRRNFSASWFQSFCGIMATLQVIVFVVECGIAGSQFNLSNWCNIEGDLLKDMGAKDPAKIVHDYQLYRLFSSVMVHSGFLHIMWNLFAQMACCWLFETGLGLLGDFRASNDNEQEEIELHRVSEGWGFRRTAVIYWTSGVAGGLLGCCLAPDRICCGASGALMGLFGARVADILSRWNPESALELSGQKTNLCSLLFQISFLAAFGLGDSKVDNWGNVGGLVTGVMMGSYFFFSDQVKVVDPTVRTVFQKAFPGLCLAMVLGISGVLAYMLFSDIVVPAENSLT